MWPSATKCRGVMTVLFADIREFTRLAEPLSPADTFRFVNGARWSPPPPTAMEVGDFVMALFPGRADDAVGPALEMLRSLYTFNDERGRVVFPHPHWHRNSHRQPELGPVGARVDGRQLDKAAFPHRDVVFTVYPA